MTSPLQASSEAYARAAEQVDDVMSAHADAMVAWNVQELIELGLGLFASYDRLDSRWREGIRQGDPQHPVEHGIHLKQISDLISSARNTVLRLIELLEQGGHFLEGSTLFSSYVFVPFDERPLDIQFTDQEFALLAKSQPKAPETICDGDDQL